MRDGWTRDWGGECLDEWGLLETAGQNSWGLLRRAWSLEQLPSFKSVLPTPLLPPQSSLTFPLVTPQGEHPLARGLRLKNLGTCPAIEAVKKEKFQGPPLAGLFMLGFLKEPYGRN